MKYEARTPRLATAAAIVLMMSAAAALAQEPAPPPGQTLTPNQLDDLVAPIALYPDELVSQILVASTYPLQVVEEYQFLQDNTALAGPALAQAARQQNWDASVQALIVFPDLVKRLNDDVTWTTNLGNAFLAQQPEVMDAIQRMRLKAEQAGKLQSSPQLNVVNTSDSGQPVIEIEPVNPDLMYVPLYDPAWIWGPAVWYPYPAWYWPPSATLAGGAWCSFGPGINVGLSLGSGWNGWAGWGWHPRWGTHKITVDNTFVRRYNFNAATVRNVPGTADGTPGPEHRGEVPLRTPSQQTARQNIAPPAVPETARNAAGREMPRNNPPAQNRGISGGNNNGAPAKIQAEHGFSSLGPQRAIPSPAPRMSAPSAPPMSATFAPRGEARR